MRSREGQRQQETPEGACPREEVVKPRGTAGGPSSSPAQSGTSPRGGQDSGLMETLLLSSSSLVNRRMRTRMSGGVRGRGLATPSYSIFTFYAGKRGVRGADRETFNRLAAHYDLIPVFKTVPADLETPISLYFKLSSYSEKSFLLESGELGEKARHSFLGSEPFLTLSTRGSITVVEDRNEKRWRSEDDPLSVLEEIIRGFKAYQPEELSAFWGGAVGYLSYDMVKWWERIPGIREEIRWPSCCFYFPRKVFIYDHRQHLLTAVCLVSIKGKSDDLGRLYEESSQELEKILDSLRGREEQCVPALSSAEDFLASLEDSGSFTRESFMAAVNRAKEYIRAGDIFQVVLSRRVQRESRARPFNVYRALRSLNPSPYQFFLSFPDFQLLGCSPEMLVKLEKGLAYTKPIAGTRPRGEDDQGDLSLAEELSKDEKEKAEGHAYIQAGAGIVADSDPYREYEETEHKMAGFFKAITLAEEWENDFNYR